MYRRLTFAVITAIVLGRAVLVLSRPLAELAGFMSDDAFYYLVPAYSFAHGDGWTLDHITRTSGFQLLYGYAAAGVSLLTGYSRAFPITMALTSVAALLAGVWMTLTRAGLIYGAGIAGAAAMITLASPRALFQITAGLEWGWVVMMTCAVVWALTRRDFVSPRGTVIVATLALLAGLTRVDLAIFVAIYCVALGWAAWRNGAPLRAIAILAASAAVGALAAIVITAVNSWAITGSWAPNSVATKEYWSRTNEFQPALSWPLLLSCTGPGFTLTRLRELLGLRSFLVMGPFFIAAAAVCIKEWKHGAQRFALACASTVAIAAYTAAYARGVNLISDHYSASIVLPMMLLTCAALACLPRAWDRVAAGVGVVALVASLAMPLPANGAHLVIAKHARSMVQALPSYSRVAGWNVGIASWMNDGRIMNLDGLANAKVVEPIQTGTLACYLATMEVTHLLDFGFMFPGQIDTHFSKDERARQQLHRERNGYDAAGLYRCVTVVDARDDAAYPLSAYRLFAIDQPCVATLCRHPKTPIDTN